MATVPTEMVRETMLSEVPLKSKGEGKRPYVKRSHVWKRRSSKRARTTKRGRAKRPRARDPRPSSLAARVLKNAQELQAIGLSYLAHAEGLRTLAAELTDRGR